MRKFLLFLFIALFAHGVYADDFVHQDEYDHLNQIKGVHERMIWNTKYVEISETIRVMNPSLYEEVKDKTEDEQLREFRNWMALEMFEYYKDYFMDLLEKKSKETGRKIKKTIYDTGRADDRYWLDGGELDEPECFDVCTRAACDFPTDFVECYISVNDHELDPVNCKRCSDTRRIAYICDEPENNIRQQYEAWLSIRNSDSTIYITFDIQTAETNYTEWHKWRNQERADIRAGMFTCSEDGDRIWVEDPKKWKSSISPGEKFRIDMFEMAQSQYNSRN